MLQDSYHYTTTWYYQSTHERIQKRDNIHYQENYYYFYFDFYLKIKQYFVQKKGMTLIIVPCWWTGDAER